MRLRAQISVDIAAADFIEAADHQTRLAEFLDTLRQQYPNAVLSIRERRERKPDPGQHGPREAHRPAIRPAG